MKTSFMYDSKANSLFVFRENLRNYYHLDLEGIIIGFNKDMKVASVEILNPDKLYKIPKNKLIKLRSAKLSAQCRGNMLMIYIILEFPNSVEERIPVNVTLKKPIPSC